MEKHSSTLVIPSTRLAVNSSSTPSALTESDDADYPGRVSLDEAFSAVALRAALAAFRLPGSIPILSPRLRAWAQDPAVRAKRRAARQRDHAYELSQRMAAARRLLPGTPDLVWNVVKSSARLGEEAPDLANRARDIATWQPDPDPAMWDPMETPVLVAPYSRCTAVHSPGHRLKEKTTNRRTGECYWAKTYDFREPVYSTANDAGITTDYILVPLRTALETHWSVEAHITSVFMRATDGTIPNRQPRISIDSVPWLREQGYDVLFSMLLCDWDTDGHIPWTPESLKAWKARWEDDPLLLGAGRYFTPSGLRVFRPLAKPVPVDHGKAILWTWLREFVRKGGQVDLKCKDWTRHMRAPWIWRKDKQAFIEPESVEWTDVRRYPIPEAVVWETETSSASRGATGGVTPPSPRKQRTRQPRAETVESFAEQYDTARWGALADAVSTAIEASNTDDWRGLHMALAGALLDLQFPAAELPAMFHSMTAKAGWGSYAQDRASIAQCTVAKWLNGDFYTSKAQLCRNWPTVDAALAQAWDAQPTETHNEAEEQAAIDEGNKAVGRVIAALPAPPPAITHEDAHALAVDAIHARLDGREDLHRLTLCRVRPDTVDVVDVLVAWFCKDRADDRKPARKVVVTAPSRQAVRELHRRLTAQGVNAATALGIDDEVCRMYPHVEALMRAGQSGRIMCKGSPCGKFSPCKYARECPSFKVLQGGTENADVLVCTPMMLPGVVRMKHAPERALILDGSPRELIHHLNVTAADLAGSADLAIKAEDYAFAVAVIALAGYIYDGAAWPHALNDDTKRAILTEGMATAQVLWPDRTKFARDVCAARSPTEDALLAACAMKQRPSPTHRDVTTLRRSKHEAVAARAEGGTIVSKSVEWHCMIAVEAFLALRCAVEPWTPPAEGSADAGASGARFAYAAPAIAAGARFASTVVLDSTLDEERFELAWGLAPGAAQRIYAFAPDAATVTRVVLATGNATKTKICPGDATGPTGTKGKARTVQWTALRGLVRAGVARVMACVRAKNIPRGASLLLGSFVEVKDAMMDAWANPKAEGYDLFVPLRDAGIELRLTHFGAGEWGFDGVTSTQHRDVFATLSIGVPRPDVLVATLADRLIGLTVDRVVDLDAAVELGKFHELARPAWVSRAGDDILCVAVADVPPCGGMWHRDNTTVTRLRGGRPANAADTSSSEGFGNTLRRAISLAGGMRKASKLLGIPLTSLSNYLSGRSPPPNVIAAVLTFLRSCHEGQ